VSDHDILFDERGSLGIVALNRPKALNALTRDMCLRLKEQLDVWAGNDDIATVVIRGLGERAFCAGGDIRALYDSGMAGTPYALEFYRDEYILNAAIKRFPKPYVALWHGMVMGGGVGVSVHGSHRIATESTVFAMPETGIGLFPDVGGSYFLSRMAGEIGMYLALTGARLKASDMLYAGVATSLMPAANAEELLSRLSKGETAEYALDELSSPAPEAPLAGIASDIQRIFSLGSVEEIVAALETDGSQWARDTEAMLRTKSPTSLKIAYRQIREGAHLSFDDCMKMEFRLVNRVVEGHDFYEGVRAVIIDKDNRPVWRPAVLADVREENVDIYFSPLGEEELQL